jgi:uncharacterized protein (UPF0276 family)
MIPSVGVGLKASHIDEALASPAAGLFFEVHAENHMVAGGPRLAMLEAAREARPLSIHGVGLSLAGHALPDTAHLKALKALADRFDPFLLSDHLAWSSLDGRALPDLLPFPRSGEALRTIARNIDHAQSLLGRPLLIENPSHYLHIHGHEWSEQDFLAELVRRTGCGLLLDLNNVHVSAFNLGFDAGEYLSQFPAGAVGEVHLAGAVADAQLDLLIDNHGSRIAEPVWDLLAGFLAMSGPRPALVEWDRNIPHFSVLIEERDKAARLIAAAAMENRDARTCPIPA